VMFWYGFEPVVNYSVKPLTSVGGYCEGNRETDRRDLRKHDPKVVIKMTLLLYILRRFADMQH